jgi:protein TonB
MRIDIAILVVLTSGAAALAQPAAPPENAPVSASPGDASARSTDCDRHAVPLPADAVRSGVESDTLLSFRIAADGTTKDVTVQRSSGNAALDKAAVAGVRCWRYKPTMEDGKPVEVPWHAAVKWRLDDEDWFGNLLDR